VIPEYELGKGSGFHLASTWAFFLRLGGGEKFMILRKKASSVRLFRQILFISSRISSGVMIRRNPSGFFAGLAFLAVVVVGMLHLAGEWLPFNVA
jgi:hypothetical protein